MKNTDHFKFVNIKAGSFMMGSPDSEKGRYSDETQHEVELSQDFEMQTTPVTQALWTEVMGQSPSHFKGKSNPVESVSWNDVQEFIGELNKLDPEYTYRLPTEAEWEYACRAGTTTAYHCAEKDLKKYAWFSENSGDKTHPVGKLQPNAWGLYDMMGNVWEWIGDWYGEY